jgi:hypothetical protein
MGDGWCAGLVESRSFLLPEWGQAGQLRDVEAPVQAIEPPVRM